MDWGPIVLSLKLSAFTSLALLIIGLPMSYFLANSKRWWKPLAEALISLPLVLPPTVIGFYWLIAFSPQSSIGQFLNSVFDLSLVFSFEGLLLASMLYSLPFMIQPLQMGMQSLNPDMIAQSRLLSKGEWMTFKKVILPSIRPSILSALVLTFAHTMGEFGVVLMIGGSISDRTKVASIALYEQVELMQYAQAHQYAFILLILSFFILVLVRFLNKKSSNLSVNG